MENRNSKFEIGKSKFENRNWEGINTEDTKTEAQRTQRRANDKTGRRKMENRNWKFEEEERSFASLGMTMKEKADPCLRQSGLTAVRDNFHARLPRASATGFGMTR